MIEALTPETQADLNRPTECDRKVRQRLRPVIRLSNGSEHIADPAPR